MAVWTGHGVDRHELAAIPPASVVRQFESLGRNSYGDSAGTRERCDLLLCCVPARLTRGTAP
jgi:hypothetical protein